MHFLSLKECTRVEYILLRADMVHYCYFTYKAYNAYTGLYRQNNYIFYNYLIF